MRIGQVYITLQRTIRVPDGRTPAQLPPGLGSFPTYKVSDYRENCPELWEDDGVFIPMHEREATWLSFRLVGTNNPRALLIGAGNVNAVTGKPLTTKLEKPQNYVVVPTQPWLDGWKDTDGVIYQFVAVEYKGGEGLTVGEQILGEESKTGGIGIAVFAPKDADLKAYKPFKEHPIVGPYDETPYHLYVKSSGSALSLSPVGSTRSVTLKEMGLGRGGRIIQKIYPDPFCKSDDPYEVWQEEPEATMAIYLVDAGSFEEITGEKAPPLPPAFKGYVGPYFKLPDEAMPDTEGSGVFAGLTSVFVDEESSSPSEKD